MTITKYEGLLGTFIVIAILLGLIFWTLVAWLGDDELDFDFPETISTEYISLLDWPPRVQVVNQSFTCLEAGEVWARAGVTQLRSVEGRNYCVTEVVEGAAGSIYTQYAYAFAKDDQTVILTFSTKASQCGNYPEGEMKECEEERAEFNMDRFISRTVERSL